MVESLMELPLNSLEQILSKLPIKSILACRCACKTLMNLTSFKFQPTLHHHALSKRLPKSHHSIRPLLPLCTLKSVHLFNAQLDINPGSGAEKLRLSSIFEIPVETKELVNFFLLNACNGLIYFAVRLNKLCSLVCNPITKEYVKVPEVLYQKTTSTSSLWLGFSPISRVYKVLRFYTYSCGVIAAHIHDVGSSSWRDVESTLLDIIDWYNSYAFISGIGYWICQYDSRFRGQPGNFIVFFDFESEIFGKIDAPPGFDERRPRYRYLMGIGIVGDLLCLIDSTESLDIWVWNEWGSWNKQFSSVDKVEKPLCGSTLRPLQLLSSHEMLIQIDQFAYGEIIFQCCYFCSKLCVTQGCSNG